MKTDQTESARDTFEQMLGNDRLDEAIDFLLALTPRDSRFRNELIGHRAELHRVEHEARVGMSTSDGRRRLRYVLLELADLIFAQPGQKPLGLLLPPTPAAVPEDVSLEKIIGANNLKKIAWLQKGLDCSAAVGRIVSGHGLGTGFLIDGNRVVTNHHVLRDAQEAGDSVIEFNFQEDVSGRLLEHHAYRLDPTRFRTDEARDVTIVGVLPSSKAPPLAQWGQLQPSAQAPCAGDHVSIIQHPGGGVKQIACTANQVVNLFGHRLQYLTDTMRGSSGAPVFDDNWKVVAIHHAGGNLSTNARGDKRYVNEGILISNIADLLR